MTGHLLHMWNLNLGDAKRFVADIPEEKIAHENMHLGQLSAWRRAQGMGRV